MTIPGKWLPIDQLCDMAQILIGPQPGTHFVQRLIDGLRDPYSVAMKDFTAGKSPAEYQAENLAALGRCFQEGRHCVKNEELGKLLIKEAVSRSKGRHRRLIEQIADPAPAKIIPLNSRRSFPLQQPR